MGFTVSLTTQENHTMTHNDFIAICNEKLIEPSIALENDEVKQAIRLDDVYWLVAILDNQF
jgi:uncharacterized protein YceH (UPF0502 family)